MIRHKYLGVSFSFLIWLSISLFYLPSLVFASEFNEQEFIAEWHESRKNCDDKNMRFRFSSPVNFTALKMAPKNLISSARINLSEMEKGVLLYSSANDQLVLFTPKPELETNSGWEAFDESQLACMEKHSFIYSDKHKSIYEIQLSPHCKNFYTEEGIDFRFSEINNIIYIEITTNGPASIPIDLYKLDDSGVSLLKAYHSPGC